MTDYSQAIQFLYDLRLFGAKLGLENTRRLAELAGNPQDKLRFIHVAGTNGKGSTCAVLESIYRHAGLRVGLFTSPHLVRFNERIQVNRMPISEPEIVRLVPEAQGWIAQFPAEAHPTFFEVVTVMALRYFAEQRCELVVWETGMGGRLDATNIVTPVASVITNIQLDHQKWLGQTIAEIAFEKAGIIKPGVPVITAAEPGAGLETIAEIARQKNGPLTVVNRTDPVDQFRLALHGKHQRLNAALALATVNVLSSGPPHPGPLPQGGEGEGERRGPLPQEGRGDRRRRPWPIAEALANVNWPGRTQVMRLHDGREVLLDGAHNPEGIRVLCEELDSSFAGRKPVIIFGVLSDKNFSEMLPPLAAHAEQLLLVPVKSDRSASVHELLSPHSDGRVPRVPCSSLPDALAKASKARFILITGSLYLVGEALEYFGYSPSPKVSEFALNEWGASKV